MVVNKIIDKFITLGFSEYEAKAYVALVQASPATAYEVARSSGIPTSKIYEVLGRLAEKGVVSEVDSGKKKRFIPITPDEFIESRKSRMESTLDALKDDLSSITAGQDVSMIWNVHDYSYFMEKAARMIEGAHKELLISGWREEIRLLGTILASKEKEGTRIAVVHFGESDSRFGQMFQHPIEDTIYCEKGGRGIVIVADSNEALMGTIHEETGVEGAWSMNSGFVTLAEDYIKHDIYVMKIVKRFDGLLKKRFGPNYAKLRDVFHDEEEP